MAQATRLRCDRLEDRELPAVVVAPLPVVLPPPVVSPAIVTTPIRPVESAAPVFAPRPSPAPIGHPVAGIGTGSYICTLQAGGVPTGFHFVGMMETKAMGRVMVQADVYGVGYGYGPARGRIILTNSKGSVTIELTAFPQPRLSRLPDWFRYRVTSSTGAYRGMTDTGTLRLSRFADPIPIRNGIRYAETGRFRLII